MGNRLLTVLAALIFGLVSVQAQDVHFSHIHASPMALNPAMTGVFDGSVRVIGNYRNQWKSVTADYQTFMASADFNIGGFGGNNIIGIGGQIISDVAGDLDFRTTATSASLSVMQALDDKKEHMIIGGVQFGQVSHRFDPSKIVAFEDEPQLFQDGASNLNYFDLSAGLLWYKKMKKGQYYYMGGSIQHLNEPDVSFYGRNGNGVDQLYRRYIVHGGANLNLTSNYTLIPNFIYMDQGPHTEFTLGSFMQYKSPKQKAEGKKMASLMLGAWMRSYDVQESIGLDAVVAAVRVDYGAMTFTLSYDFNVSSLSAVSNGRGGPELSLIYTFGRNAADQTNASGGKPTSRKGKVKCPIF